MYPVSRDIITARKAHRCDQCCQNIEPGTRYLREARNDNGFYTYRSHRECDRAAGHLRRVHRGYFNDGINLMSDLESDDYEWLAARHPAAAMRFGVVITPYL